MLKKTQFILLGIIPLVFLLIGLKFDRTRFGTDPESAYLMNGINIAMGKSVGHYDNPGTTVQMFSAVVLRITHSIRSTDQDLQSDVLLNSEYYIEVLRYSFIVINALILLLLGVVAFMFFGSIWPAMVLQISPFLSVTLIEECFTKVAPEQFLFTATLILVICLIKYLKSQDSGSVKYAVIFALISGFGIATKMTFLPFMLIPLLVLSGKRNRWIYLFSVPPAFVIFTLPAVTVYPQMAFWFLNLGTHTGTYGSGSKGIIDFAQYSSALVSIAKNNKALVLIMLSGISYLGFTFINKFKSHPEDDKKVIRQLAATVIGIASSIILVAKHYHSNHYLFPAFSIMGFTMVLLVSSISIRMSNKEIKGFRFLLPAIFAILIGAVACNIPYTKLAYQGYLLSNQSTADSEAQLNTIFKEYSKVYYYPVSFNNFNSLKWGNVYARQHHTTKLMELFPDGLFYNTIEKSFQHWETKLTPDALLKKCKEKILLVGGPRTDEELRQVEKDGFKLRKLFEGRVQALYEIDIENSPLFNTANKKSAPVWSVSVGFEKTSADGKFILSPDGARFCTNSSVTNQKGNSGLGSVSLPDFDSYGMDYELTDVKPNDYYELSIWRYGSKKDAFLIISAGQADPLYLQTDGYTETNREGWQKLELSIKIPEGFKSNKLKIYLWNHSKNPVWFDDFTITKF